MGSSEQSPNFSLFIPSEKRLKQGFINTVAIYKNPDGENLVRRSASNFDEIITRLRDDEYPSIGFTGSVRGLTLPEQAAHMDRAVALGLATISPINATEEVLWMPYIKGRNLRRHLRRGKTEYIEPTLDSLNDAHQKEFVFGDRWAGNIMITKDGKPVHIDFDVLVQGKNAVELEMAQLFYSILSHTSKPDKANSILAKFVQTHPNYDWGQVGSFMKKYDAYWTRHGEKSIMKNEDTHQISKITSSQSFNRSY